MTREEWDAKQNSLKKQYKYVPTGKAGEVDEVEIKHNSGEEAEEDGGEKGKKKKDEGRKLSSQYGKYSGNINAEGKAIDRPTELEAIKTNLEYMKHNASDQSSSPSNIYRPENAHKAINYNKKKEEAKMNKAK